jgi:hypothetical protein
LRCRSTTLVDVDEEHQLAARSGGEGVVLVGADPEVRAALAGDVREPHVVAHLVALHVVDRRRRQRVLGAGEHRRPLLGGERR